MKRSGVPWFALLLLLLLAAPRLFALQAPAPPPGAPAAKPPPEPPAPKPSDAVQKLLDEANRFASTGQLIEALAAADRALTTARETKDMVGEARAHRSRALFLFRLKRNDESPAAWRAAAEAWERVGDEPGRMEALAATAVLLAKEQPTESTSLLNRALEWGHAEKVRPLAAATALHTIGNLLYDQRRFGDAQRFWAAAVAIREKRAPDSPDVARSLYNLALLAGAQGDLDTAEGNLRRALAIVEKHAPDTLQMAQTLNNLGVVMRNRGDLKAAQGFYERAVGILERVAPDAEDLGLMLGNLGVILGSQGDLDAAEQYYRRALAFYQKRGPDSVEAARMLQNLGVLARQRGDLETATRYARQALAVQEKLGPESPAMVESLISLGNIAVDRSELQTAQAHYQRAVALAARVEPHSLIEAGALMSLGRVSHEQGALEVAGEYYGRALAIQERVAPQSPDVAITLENLGLVAAQQRDHVAALEYYRRSLALREKQAPESLEMAHGLTSLGTSYKELSLVISEQNQLEEGRKKLEEARQCFQRALAIQEKRAPNSLDAAASLVNLGNIEQEQGNFVEAETLIRRALALQEKAAPDSPAVARSLNILGVTLLKQNNFGAARQYLQRAMELQKKLAPFSLTTAECQYNLSLVAILQKDWNLAERLMREAWDLHHRMAGHVAGDEARQAFGAAARIYSWRLMVAQATLGKAEAAFATLEESRAQALQQLLLERQLTARTLPGDLWSRYRSALAARDRAEQAISQASISEAQARGALAVAREAVRQGRSAEGSSAVTQRQAALESAVRQREATQSTYTQARIQVDRLWAQIKKAAPRAFPPPLPLARVRKALPPGTLFLAFGTANDPIWPTAGGETLLFLVQPASSRGPAVSVYPVNGTELQWQRWVKTFRQQVSDPDTGMAGAVATGRSLFTQLFPPAVQDAIRKAPRLLISPDGPLWELPFAALVTNGGGNPHYLGAQKAITYAPSLGLFAQNRQDRPRTSGSVARPPAKAGAARSPKNGPQPPVAVVVGDPIFDRPPTLVAAAGDAALPVTPFRGERNSLFVNRAPPARLPETRPEAERIAKLYGGQPLLGERATEAALRQRLQGADVIHLATHGFLNPVRAMSSGLLLTLPAKEPALGQSGDDGALQAWEIYSQLQLKAELVVLSACETGRGENVAGEGIVGLTRALQYAGARSIVASQWKVADASTATLMVSFHRKLRAGLPKDEALRQAMAGVRQDRRTAHPYFWAPFFLMGDPDNPALGVLRGKP